MKKKEFARVILPAVLLLAAATGSVVADSKKPQTPLQISERQLKDLSQAVHHARKAAADLVIECSRENDVMGGEIDFIGGDIIPIIPATAEGFGGPGFLPPRPQYLQLHMNQLSSVLPLLKSEIDTIKAPDTPQAAAITPFTAEMQTVWDDVQKHYTALGPLVQNIDSAGIVTEATALNKSLHQLEKLKKDIYKAYKHPAKSTATAGD